MVSNNNYLQEIVDKLKFSKDVIEKYFETYGKDAKFVLDAIKVPPTKYYLRVNRTKISKIETLLNSLIEKKGNRNTFFIEKRIPFTIGYVVKGPYEIPQSTKAVLADKVAAEAVYLGSHLYAPGILKCEKIEKGTFVSVYDRAENIVGSGITRMDCKEIMNIRKGLAVEIKYSKFKTPRLHDLPEYHKGLFYPQSLPAIVISHIVQPNPKEVIVDICAAPGGKTTAIAEILRNKGRVIAFDRSKNRLKKMWSHIMRLGLKNIRLVNANILDYQYYVKKEFADKVLIDPPCSNLGLRPKLFDFRKKKQLESYPSYQKLILKAAYRMLRKEGLLIYSTCTITLSENEEVINWALENLKLEPAEIPKEYFIGSKSKMFSNSAMRFEPHKDDTPGFFVSVLRKI